MIQNMVIITYCVAAVAIYSQSIDNLSSIIAYN